MDWLLKWWPVILFVTQALQGWFIWSLKQQFISRADCKDCKKDRDTEDAKASDKVENLKDGVARLPTREEVRTLGETISRLTEKLGHLDGRLSGINRAVDLLNQHHLRVNG